MLIITTKCIALRLVSGQEYTWYFKAFAIEFKLFAIFTAKSFGEMTFHFQSQVNLNIWKHFNMNELHFVNSIPISNFV